MHDLEVGYTGLSHKLAVDREALIMMCHQYAYADKIPKEYSVYKPYLAWFALLDGMYKTFFKVGVDLFHP